MPHPSSHSNMYTNVSNDNNDLHNMNIKQIVMLIFSSSHQLHCCQCKLLTNLSFWEQISFQSFFLKSFLSAIHSLRGNGTVCSAVWVQHWKMLRLQSVFCCFLHQLWGCEDRQNCQFSQKVSHSLAEADGNQQHTLWESSLVVLETPQSMKLHRKLQTTHDLYIHRRWANTHFPPTLSSVSPNSSDELEDPARRVLATSATHIRGKQHTTLD